MGVHLVVDTTEIFTGNAQENDQHQLKSFADRLHRNYHTLVEMGQSLFFVEDRRNNRVNGSDLRKNYE